ncbi:MAG: SDR family oxidoreductase [Polyangiaceae bacterium]|jgi:3-oxoacyl-[acyl-carrier protein] reductase
MSGPSLAGRVAIVTGGSRGIGIAIARALGAEGARVAIASRTQRELDAARATLEGDGVEVLARATDVARFTDVKALVDEVEARWGRVDALVNNAGVNGAIGRLDESDTAEWKLAFEVNVFGTMHACRAVLPGMRARRRGKIVNLAGGGVGGPGVAPRVSAYAASKAAVVQLTESLARELVDDGVQVNAIAPGAVVTEMTAAVVAAGPDKAGKELYERTLKQRESGGEPPDLAAKLVVWLASDASGALTGKMLSAKWDKVEAIDAATANRSSLFALRRIDGALFDEVRK